MMVLVCFFGVAKAAEYLHQRSAICKRILPLFALNTLPQFPKNLLLIGRQPQVFVEVFCQFAMWNLTVRLLWFLLSTLCGHLCPFLWQFLKKKLYVVLSYISLDCDEVLTKKGWDLLTVPCLNFVSISKSVGITNG